MPADAANQNALAPTEAAGGVPVAKEAPTEQQLPQAGVPKKITNAQTVCNEKNAKGKLCNGHLKQMKTGGEEALKHLRGDDALFQCQTCGTLYMGPPLGHVRDPEKQSRFVEKELTAILRAAGGTLPAFKKSERGTLVPLEEDTSHHAPAAASTAAKPATPAKAVPATPATKPASAAGGSASTPSAPAPSTAPSASTSGTDSSSEADRHRPAAEAQAATGQASAAPMSSAASTASPAAGAETVSDLAPEASTELTPSAPKDERKPDSQPASDSQPAVEDNKT
ncbi:MAG TPA: hypothetical protein VGC66_17440 [Pyrinomonadaceae bacterium]|jgi:hypothetical protein